MQCPVCLYDNIEGVDECARCQAALSDVETQVHPSDIEQDLLSRPLGELATRNYVEVAPDHSVRETLQEWIEANQHCVIVTEGDAIVGIVTERDVVNKLAHDPTRHADSPIRDYMTPDPTTLESDVPVAFGLNRMMVGGYRHIPIVHDGKLKGVVSVRDVLAYLTTQFDDAISSER